MKNIYVDVAEDLKSLPLGVKFINLLYFRKYNLEYNLVTSTIEGKRATQFIILAMLPTKHAWVKRATLSVSWPLRQAVHFREKILNPSISAHVMLSTDQSKVGAVIDLG